MLTPALKNYFFYTGLVLLSLAILVTVSSLSGLVTLPETFLGNESTIHSVARIAVLGCVLAAIGSWEQTPSNSPEEQHHDATF